MVSIDTVEKGLYDWAVLVLGATIPIIWYHENAPRPNKPYVALHLSTINSIGHDFVDGSGNLTGNRDFMLLCQGIGKHSMDYLEALKTSLCKPKIQEFLRGKNIVYVDRLALSCIAEVVDSRYEERNMLDLKFRFAQMDTDLSGIIEKAYLCHDIIDVDLITITQLSVCSMIPPVIIPPVLPDAPVLTDATPENGEVDLTWSSVSEANTYNLYYAEGDTVDKDGTKITGALSPFSLTGLTNDTEYAFAVSSVNEVGESELSNILTATPVAPPPPAPPAPVLTSVTPGNTSVSVSWLPSVGASFYVLYYAEGETVDKNGTAYYYVDSPTNAVWLTNGTKYAFAVTAYNDDWVESDLSNIMTATPVAPPLPDAPVLDSVTTGDDRLTIAWLPVIDAVSYNLYWKQGATVTKLTGAKITGVNSPYVKTGLIDNTEYAFGVTAVNINGESLLSNVLTGTPAETDPPFELVGWWKGEDNTVDSVNGNSMIWSGTPVYDTGYIGRCFVIPKWGNTLKIPYTTNLNLSNDWEVECYIYVATENILYGQWFKILYKAATSTWDGIFDITIQANDTEKLWVRFSYGTDTCEWNNRVPVNEWVKFRLSCKDGYLSLFINDVDQGDQDYGLRVSPPVPNNNNPFWITGSWDLPYTYQLIDELKISRGLT